MGHYAKILFALCITGYNYTACTLCKYKFVGVLMQLPSVHISETHMKEHQGYL